MTTYQKSKRKITEEDVMFYDIDPVLDGDTFRVQPTPNSEWVQYSFSEFAGWLQDTGRLDWADNDAERCGADHCSYTYQEFWRNIALSTEADTLLPAYLADLNNAEAEAAELEAFRADEWAEFYDNTKA